MINVMAKFQSVRHENSIGNGCLWVNNHVSPIMFRFVPRIHVPTMLLKIQVEKVQS